MYCQCTKNNALLYLPQVWKEMNTKTSSLSRRSQHLARGCGHFHRDQLAMFNWITVVFELPQN